MLRGNETPLYKTGKACEILGIKPNVLRKWDKNGTIKAIRTPGGIRLFDITSIAPEANLTKHKIKNTPVVILYSRVSSQKQKQDLERQQKYLDDNCPDEYSGSKNVPISDIGSGINFKRSGLLRILGQVKEGTVSAIVVASRDRLARFGFELIEWFCEQYGTKIVVLNNKDSTPESELGEDLMAIVQVYCCRWNGRRRYQKRRNNTESSQSSETETASESGAKVTSQSMGRLLKISLQQNDSTIDEQKKQNSEKRVSCKRPLRDNQKQKDKKN